MRDEKTIKIEGTMSSYNPNMEDVEWYDFMLNELHTNENEDYFTRKPNSRYHDILPIEDCELTEELFCSLIREYVKICNNHKAFAHLETSECEDDVDMKVSTDSERTEGDIAKEIAELKKGHYRDKNIRFYDEGHRYTINNSSRGVISTTTLIHLFFPPFQPKKVALRTLNKKRREKEYKLCETVDDVQKIWKYKRDLGTSLHANIEQHWNGARDVVPEEGNVDTFQQFLTMWYKSFDQYLVPHLSEYSVYDVIDNMKLAGNIDGVAKVKKFNNTYDLFDWKRSKTIYKFAFERLTKISERTPEQKRNMSGYGCCSSIDNCNKNTYQLQLNVYKYMLEKNNDMCVRKMYIVQFYPRKRINRARITCVANLQDVVQKMVSSWYHACNLFENAMQHVPIDIVNIVKSYYAAK